MDDIVILDRDGVINVDLMTYVTRPEDFKPIKGSLEAIALLNKSGFKIAIATNQACIEKKIIPDDVLIISESGIKSPEDISFLGKENINNFLIGESLMKSNKISEDLNLLVNKGE